MPSFDYSSFISPFTWRYGSQKMRNIFSEKHKYELWRHMWVSIAKAQHTAGLISDKELTNLEENKQNINIEEILQIETETQHDIVAAIKEFALKAPFAAGKIHLGATSMDIVDNVEVMRVKEGLDIIEDKIKEILNLLSQKIADYADTPCLGYTHLQPAEPTTVGYRLAFYAQDLLMDFKLLRFVKERILKGKGIKGAVGTQASFSELLKGKESDPLEMEKEIMNLIGIDAVEISTQVYSRKIDYLVLIILASTSSSIAKFAGDLRILQSPSIGEWSEPFGENQIGSSAMPFKKNPINAEKICSLARMISFMPQVALENATLSYLERTLDDSANRRIITPEAFLSTDEVLISAKKILKGLIINKQKIAANLALYAPFTASEGILMKAVKNGADRQVMHEVLRRFAITSWESIQQGKQNPMKELIINSEQVKKYIPSNELGDFFDISTHIGTAPQRAREILNKIKEIVT